MTASTTASRAPAPASLQPLHGRVDQQRVGAEGLGEQHVAAAGRAQLRGHVDPHVVARGQEHRHRDARPGQLGERVGRRRAAHVDVADGHRHPERLPGPGRHPLGDHRPRRVPGAVRDQQQRRPGHRASPSQAVPARPGPARRRGPGPAGSRWSAPAGSASARAERGGQAGHRPLQRRLVGPPRAARATSSPRETDPAGSPGQRPQQGHPGAGHRAQRAVHQRGLARAAPASARPPAARGPAPAARSPAGAPWRPSRERCGCTVRDVQCLQRRRGHRPDAERQHRPAQPGDQLVAQPALGRPGQQPGRGRGAGERQHVEIAGQGRRRSAGPAARGRRAAPSGTPGPRSPRRRPR